MAPQAGERFGEDRGKVMERYLKKKKNYKERVLSVSFNVRP